MHATNFSGARTPGLQVPPKKKGKKEKRNGDRKYFPILSCFNKAEPSYSKIMKERKHTVAQNCCHIELKGGGHDVATGCFAGTG